MLGNGETLRTVEACVGDMLDSCRCKHHVYFIVVRV